MMEEKCVCKEECSCCCDEEMDCTCGEDCECTECNCEDCEN